MNRIPILEGAFPETPVIRLKERYAHNTIFVKRDDLLPFAFGGNKVRKAAVFYREIIAQEPDVIMTYGAEGSNHCRVIAMMAYMMGLPCHIIAPAQDDGGEVSANRRIVLATGASIETVPVDQVAQTIENRTAAFGETGKRVYFIQGGGHGNPGTEGCIRAYDEILVWERGNGISFDRIFHASGTGATQAGLVCGELLTRTASGESSAMSVQGTRITGISIARDNPRGAEVVRESVRDYLGARAAAYDIDAAVEFVDDYTLGGYGKTSDAVEALMERMLTAESLPLDHTYTGKAFHGMLCYLEEHGIRDKDILFLHTGGTPLFFDDLTQRRVGLQTVREERE